MVKEIYQNNEKPTDDEEYERAIAGAYTEQDWISIYNKLFGDLPDSIEGDWGAFH